MSKELLLFEIYMFFIILLGVCITEYIFSKKTGLSYLATKAEMELLLDQYRLVKTESSKKAKRKIAKIQTKIHVLRSSLRRYILTRLFALSPVYIATILITMLRLLPLPATCCIPLLTLELEGRCFILTPSFAAISFLLILPLIQEDFFTILLYEREKLKTP